jgi:hypothetical protein
VAETASGMPNAVRRQIEDIEQVAEAHAGEDQTVDDESEGRQRKRQPARAPGSLEDQHRRGDAEDELGRRQRLDQSKALEEGILGQNHVADRGERKGDGHEVEAAGKPPPTAREQKKHQHQPEQQMHAAERVDARRTHRHHVEVEHRHRQHDGPHRPADRARCAGHLASPAIISNQTLETPFEYIQASLLIKISPSNRVEAVAQPA